MSRTSAATMLLFRMPSRASPRTAFGPTVTRSSTIGVRWTPRNGRVGSGTVDQPLDDPRPARGAAGSTAPRTARSARRGQPGEAGQPVGQAAAHDQAPGPPRGARRGDRHLVAALLDAGHRLPELHLAARLHDDVLHRAGDPDVVDAGRDRHEQRPHARHLGLHLAELGGRDPARLDLVGGGALHQVLHAARVTLVGGHQQLAEPLTGSPLAQNSWWPPRPCG